MPVDLVASPFAASLVELDFALGTLSDAGASIARRQARAAFPALRSLNVFHCSLSAAGLDGLRRAGFAVVERPPSERWKLNPHLRAQKHGRYISDSE